MPSQASEWLSLVKAYTLPCLPSITFALVPCCQAHERNLNTDVLLGLLSVALPLRRKASEEGSLPPLKLVVMSATLRVEDFTENARLFPKGEVGVATKPALVKVPGRTHPVSIHHSKVTELDDYGECRACWAI